MVQHISQLLKTCVPLREYEFSKSCHPWINEKCVSAIVAKHSSEGTTEHYHLQETCSEILFEEYSNHVQRTKAKNTELP